MLNFKERIKRNFSKSAKEYEKHSWLQRQLAIQLLRDIPADNYETILDVGCGTGLLTFALAQRFSSARICAVDLAPGMIEYAKSKVEFKRQIEFYEGDGEKLPFAEQSFDLVVSSSAIQWMDPSEFFFEARRILKPKRGIYFSFFGKKTLVEIRDVIGDEEDINYPDLDGAARILEKTGFGSIQLSTQIRRAVFSDIFGLIRYLKGLGAQSGGGFKGLGARDRLALAGKKYLAKYPAENGIFASFEVIWGRGIKR